ncbi:O-antigen ligase family protein [Bacillus sp. FJAT-27251]|uniref:O-antigen ligase family protein n=1 Tax=Bacillus sp. FJAT-27251 TaxID=1684142 RepID=UPI0006A7AD3C|nr:O-antigen ligase family protein [Bacillus sp. FJAT-27251]
MLKYLFLLGVMGEWVFFLVLSLFNYSYAGSSESNIYILYWVIIFLLTFIVLIIYIFNYIKIGRFPKLFLSNILPVLLILILYLISFSLFGFNENGNLYYAKIFVSMCIPTFFLGYLCSIQNKENQLIDVIVKFVLFGTFILTISLYRLITENTDVSSLDSIGGVGRLGIGYLAAHFFIVTFYIFLFYDDKKWNLYLPFFLKGKFKNLILFIMLTIQLSTVVFSGSRGPLLNLILVSLLIIIMKIRQGNIIAFVKMITSVFLIFLFIIFMFNNFAQNFFSLSTERTLTLFQLDEDSWAGGSGREKLYPLALNMFSESPFLGSGPMGFLSESGANMHPHNIILEVMADYGLVGLLLIILFFSFIFKRYSQKAKINTSIFLVLFLFFSSLIELQVSGTFMANARLWFFIGLGMGFINIKEKI